MKNNECTIYIITKNGAKQSFRKNKDSWIQTSSKGRVRRCTAEQVLSHILPPLAFKHVTLKVEPDYTKEKQNSQQNRKQSLKERTETFSLQDTDVKLLIIL